MSFQRRLDHASHAKAVDLTERVQGRLSNVDQKLSNNPVHELSINGCHLGVYQHKRNNGIVDMSGNFCGIKKMGPFSPWIGNGNAAYDLETHLAVEKAKTNRVH